MQARSIRGGRLGFVLAMLATLSSGCSMFHGEAGSGIKSGDIVQNAAPGTDPHIALAQYQEGIVGQPGPDSQLPPGAYGPAGEGRMVSLPTYTVEPPDVLLIYAPGAVPRSPYFIQPQDQLQIVVVGTPPDQPIAGVYLVETGGIVTLGPAYGTVRLAGLTAEEARDEIVNHLSSIVQAPEVSLTVVQMAGQQDILGEHLVGPDGTVTLGKYGSVYVCGMTLAQARLAIEQHLSQYLENPQISLDVYSYNSKVYYVITSGAGLGDSITQLPITGNDTVLSALSRIGGLNQLASTNMWIARPAGPGMECDQILPIDYLGITMGGSSATNYQLFPNDRLYVASDKFVRLEQRIAKIIGPFERIFGITLFGAQTIQNLQRFPRGNQNGNF